MLGAVLHFGNGVGKPAFSDHGAEMISHEGLVFLTAQQGRQVSRALGVPCAQIDDQVTQDLSSGAGPGLRQTCPQPIRQSLHPLVTLFAGVVTL